MKTIYFVILVSVSMSLLNEHIHVKLPLRVQSERSIFMSSVSEEGDINVSKRAKPLRNISKTANQLVV